MTKTRLHVAYIGGCFLCVSPVTLAAQSRGVAVDSVSIVAASRAFSDAYVRNDTLTLGMVYSDSAVLLPPGRKMRGRSSVRRYFSWSGEYRQLAHAMESTELNVVGNVGIDAGTWTSTGRRGDADPVTTSGRYLVIWVRESDGVWRILYDMWHRPAR